MITVLIVALSLIIVAKSFSIYIRYKEMEDIKKINARSERQSPPNPKELPKLVARGEGEIIVMNNAGDEVGRAAGAVTWSAETPKAMRLKPTSGVATVSVGGEEARELIEKLKDKPTRGIIH